MKKAVIFGCGMLGKTAYPILSKLFNIVAFSDNNSSLWGSNMDVIKTQIVPPIQIPELIGNDGMVIICSYYHYGEIARQLENMKIPLNYSVFIDNTIVGYNSKKGIILADYYKNIKIKPERLFIELSSKCNIHCRYCPLFAEKSIQTSELQEYMKWDVVKAIAEQAKKISTFKHLMVSGRGEALMNPDWYNMISHIIRETTIEDVCIYTNGMALSKDNVDKLSKLDCKCLLLRISIDGLSPNDSEYWRYGSSYSIIKENLKYAIKILKKKTEIMICNTCVLPAGCRENEYYKILRLIEPYGDYLRAEFPEAIVWSHPAFAYSMEVDGAEVLEIDDINYIPLCKNRFNLIGVWVTGDIISCPTSIAAIADTIVMGNVLQDNLYDVWMNNTQVNKIRNSFYKGYPECSDYCETKAWSKKRILVRKK